MQGDFALCAYATCVTIPKSNPPVAECGCYAFNGPSLGAGTGVLNKQVRGVLDTPCFFWARLPAQKGNPRPLSRRALDKQAAGL